MKPSDTKNCAPTPWRYEQYPALVAHRGFARLFPENTLPAIAAAIDAGARFVEFDLQLSKDLVPFLMHDDNFKRTGDVQQSVFDLPMKSISDIAVGEPARLGGRFHDVKPITLEHLCAHLNEWPDVRSFIEVKEESIEQFGLAVTMDKIFEAVRSLTAPFTIISFAKEVIEYAQANSPHNSETHSRYNTGWVIPEWNEQNLAILATMNPDFVYFDHKALPEIDALPQGSWSWVFYEVTDDQDARHLRSIGAHMIETMAVSSMLNSPTFASPNQSAQQ